MEKVKFIHCSDIHLDMPFKIGWDKSGKRRRDLKDVMRKIIDIAVAKEVNFIIISGDLYENEYVSKSTILFLDDLFRRVLPIKVIITPGNHDPYIKNSFYKNFNWSDNVYIFHKNNKKLSFGQNNICIYGDGFDDFYKSDNGINDFEEVDESNTNILVMHGTVDVEIGSEMYNFVKSEDIDKLGFDYVALGHFHNKILGIGNKKNIYNPGCPEPLKFGDEQECGVFVVTIDIDNGKKVDVEFIKTNKRYYKSIAVRVDDCSTDDQIIKKILEKLAGLELDNGLFSFNFTGCLENGFEIDFDYIEEKLKGIVFYAKIIDNTSTAYDIEEISAEIGLRGVFTKKILEEIKASTDDREIELLRKALYYGLEAIDKGKIENI